MGEVVCYHFRRSFPPLPHPMPFVQENWILIAVAFVSGAMLVWPLVQRRFSPMKAVGTLDATRLINSRDAVLLDVRDQKEFDASRMLNAIHIPLAQLESRGGELKKYGSRPVIAYCDVGNRSRMAGAALVKAGIEEVYHLNGGLRAWKAAGLPVETPKEAK